MGALVRLGKKIANRNKGQDGRQKYISGILKMVQYLPYKRWRISPTTLPPGLIINSIDCLYRYRSRALSNIKAASRDFDIRLV